MMRWTLLGLMPAAMVIGAATDHDEDAAPALPLQAQAIQSKAVPETPSLELSTLRRDKVADPVDAFESKSWFVPPPPPPPAAPAPARATMPPAPVAPKLPFTFLGQYQEDERLVIMLMKGEQMLTVKAGDVIDNRYRVEGMEGSHLMLLYLPMGVRQALDTGGPG